MLTSNRHWPVFWGSLAVLLVTWGLVPTQTGIFSVESVTRTSVTPFVRSTSFIPADQQATKLTLRYAQSTYGIATLNETLPPYMARNYTLAPFKPMAHDTSVAGSSGTWTGRTTLYSLDLYCKNAPVIRDPANKFKYVNYKSDGGCNVTLGLTGNVTEGYNSRKSYSPLLSAKKYMAMYIGYWNPNGFADYSLDSSCPPDQNATFYAAFTKTKVRAQDPPENVTAIFCKPVYYEQKVDATVDRVTRRPIKVTAVEEKQPLSNGLFNSTQWEGQMTGSSGIEVRGNNMPTIAVPDYLEYLAGTNVSLVTGPTGGGIVQRMVGLSLAVSNQPLEDYLDWTVLSKSYADGYRVLFARTMVDILGDDFASSENITGQQQYTIEAVVLDPVFVYVVEGLLGAVSLSTAILLYLSVTRTRNLRTDPSTIASIMSLVAENESLLFEFENLDCCTVLEVQQALGEKRFRLFNDGQHAGIEIVGSAAAAIFDAQKATTPSQRQNTPRGIAKPVRPKEFRLWTGIPFVSLFITLSIALAIIFVKAKADGLPLPSTKKLVQNILENYIPTALATLIEPMWVMINRLLCMLQPLEELRSCKAEAKDSIDLNYSSLPPQLTFFKALRSKHFVLAAVCAMALLSNLLAVAFAGMFNQDLVDVQRAGNFSPPYEMKFVSINGSIGPKSALNFGSEEPSGAYRGGNSQDQYLIAESNFTQGTPLPAWTDEKMFYLPYMAVDSVNTTDNDRYEANTVAFGAELDCETLKYGVDYLARVETIDNYMQIKFNTTARAGSNVPICPANKVSDVRYGPERIAPYNINETCQRGPSATEVTWIFDAKANATQSEKNACMTTVVLGWIRAPDGSCGDFRNRDLTAQNSLFVRCKPRLVKGRAGVQTDGGGRLQNKVDSLKFSDVDQSDVKTLFSNDPVNLLAQSNLYLFKPLSSGWHNDSYAEDFTNYFAMRESNSSRLVDPTLSVPTLEDVRGPLGQAYSRLFAIWLGANKEKLLVPQRDQTRSSVRGWTISTERRLFLSTPMFAISEGILCIYTIVAIVVYLRRPGRYLARMPTSLASIISLFAASAAVQDLRQTSHLDKKGRAKHLELLDSRYGYGSYVGGGDGRVHIGIEKTPFVTVRSKTTWMDQNVKLFRKGAV